MNPIENRYEFVLFYDVENGNPNGDPDAGNMPRIDPEDNRGLVTDVCLKRKIRNYVELSKDGDKRFNIYVQEKAVLNRRNQMAYDACGLEAETRKGSRKTKDENKSDKKTPPDELEEKLKTVRNWMCNNFYDIRTFGAVMTTGVNCGQVRGPVQIAFSKSIDPVMPTELTITRVAVTSDEEKEAGKDQMMGRKFIVPYGLYRAEGFISAPLAAKTGFSKEDLDLLWEALVNMFEHDHSAARGKMSSRKLYVFRHDSKMGNAPAHKLFECITANKTSEGPARAFGDYEIAIDHGKLDTLKAMGVTMEEKI